jgi:serine/threonine protein kinase
MRTRLEKQHKKFPPRISTPTVQDASQFPSDILHVSFDGSSSVQAKLQILKPLGSGGQGEVLDARLLFFETDDSGAQQIREYPCVAKHLKTISDPRTPFEFKMQQALTSGHPSDESGLLRIMGIHTVTGDDGRIHKYAIMPKCAAILSDCLPAIRTLDENEQTRPVFYHVIMNFLHSISRGLQNLSEHQVIHRDHKLENMGLHNRTWCMLDFGLARTYEDFIYKKGSQKRGMIEGTPHYISPETINDESDYPFEGDVWALGQILRKLRGESYSYQHDENGRDLALMVHLYKKVSAYIEERNKKISDASAFDAANYQLELQNSISKQSNFKDCLDTIVNAMCSVLPEYRPSLETLQKACVHLESLLPTLSANDQLDQFYRQITQGAEAEEMEITASTKKLEHTATSYHSQRFFVEKKEPSVSTEKSHATYSAEAEINAKNNIAP